MNAIDFLIQQHLEVESLFDQFESASNRAGKTKLRLCWKLGDLLAVHAAIEEAIFYPAAKDARTEPVLEDALEEHLWVRRIVAELAELDEVDDHVETMMAALRKRKKRHADEEEKTLFVKARELLAPEWLEELGRRMEKMAEQLTDGAPRRQVPNEAERAPRTSHPPYCACGRSAGCKSRGTA